VAQQYDSEGYGQAHPNTDFIPPRRTDALDDSFADDGETPGFVVKPEPEIAARLTGEQPPTPTAPEQTSFFDRIDGFLGTVGSTIKAILPKPEQQLGGVIYNPRHGNIIKCIGILTEKELASRQERISEGFSNKALLAVDLPTYTVLEPWVEAFVKRQESLNYKQAILQIQEHRQRLNIIQKLALDRGWAWAVRKVVPPPTPVPLPDRAFILFWEMGKTIYWQRPWPHLGPARLIATPFMMESELERCFANGRRLDAAMEEFQTITFQRRDAELLRQHQERVNKPPPLPGPNADRTLRHIYGQ
jgi:hypothetical protein